MYGPGHIDQVEQRKLKGQILTSSSVFSDSDVVVSEGADSRSSFSESMFVRIKKQHKSLSSAQ